MSTKVSKGMCPENQEFIAMAKLCGWSQAEVARQLLLTRGAVSQIFHGKTRPHRRTLYLFKMILTKQDRSGVEGSPNAWESEVLAWLRRIHRAQRQRLLEAVKLLVTACASGKPQPA
jgi:transcriptional regulator with XRE-family HTH domain